MENGRHPLSRKPRPLLWARLAGRAVQVGGGFLWTRSFTYRKTERKLRIKLFDRYFSSFSQQVSTWCFLVWFYLLLLYTREQQRSSSPLRNKLTWAFFATESFFCEVPPTAWQSGYNKLKIYFSETFWPPLKTFQPQPCNVFILYLKINSGSLEL